MPTTAIAAVAATPATEAVVETEAASDVCPEYFRFCTAVQISGAVTAEATAGAGGNFGTCDEWAAGGAARILELPFVLAAGDPPVTVALTRLGSYTGAGQYEMAATTTSGNPDAFPALDVGGRTFSNGEGSAAVVTVAADGSGTITATGLVEIASPQVTSPDPDARVDFAMQWTCQGTGN
ncbi:MAG: hypothetical protein DWI57_03315 [Chloroflexi bacterium]|nr:MAG: hypothetical protein DWI57_03315 [Chloroflexota bacterium]